MVKLEKEIKEIKDEIINESSICIEMLHKAVRALMTFDKELCEQVIETDKKVDELEIEIENKVIRVIALYQPEAEMLRTAIMAVKINKDFERIGDHAVNIASNVLKSIDLGKVEIPEEVTKIFNSLTVMTNKTIRAFVDRDSNIAKEVISMDKEIDSYRDIGIRKAIETSSNMEEIILKLLVFKDLERIGDLLTNIAEDVVYIVEGKIIEHKYK
jgi:phosphate transport system protein